MEWATAGGWAVVKKAGEDLLEGVELRVTDDAELRYVSRGGLKLEGALRHTGLQVAGETVLDLGQSTGGFTDCLLAAEARHVVGVDVGHGQLHARLQADARVTALEGVHVRELGALQRHVPTGGFPLVVGDLSFISMIDSLPYLLPWLAPHGQLLLLIKAAVRARAPGRGQGRPGQGRGRLPPPGDPCPPGLHRPRASRCTTTSTAPSLAVMGTVNSFCGHSDENPSHLKPAASRALGRSRAGEHPHGGSAGVLDGRGAGMTTPSVSSSFLPTPPSAPRS